MKKELVEKIFKKVYPLTTIVSIEVLPRNEYVDGEWKSISPAIFVGIKDHSVDGYSGISSTLTNLTNYEFNVFLE
jgi:hypothetical protein